MSGPTAADETELLILRMAYGDLFRIGFEDGPGFYAARRDMIGGMHTAAGVGALRDLIRADPVARLSRFLTVPASGAPGGSPGPGARGGRRRPWEP